MIHIYIRTVYVVYILTVAIYVHSYESNSVSFVDRQLCIYVQRKRPQLIVGVVCLYCKSGALLSYMKGNGLFWNALMNYQHTWYYNTWMCYNTKCIEI